MLQYMFNAQVGDDVYKQDPTVIELESSLAACLAWKQLCFSFGTMANQTALKLHTQPGTNYSRQICTCLPYEGGGASFNSGVSFAFDGKRGMITAEQVAELLTILSFINH
jgi:threonine aldolase